MNDAASTPPMPDARHCPQCGTPLPTGALAGLCPACLLQQGAAADTATDGKQPPFMPPSVEEIARIFPQLEILGLLGKGGMGAVYKARQPALDRFVALKILPATAGSEAGFAERFAREARALARLSHPHIVTLFEFGSVGQASRLPPSAAPGLTEAAPQGPASERTEPGAAPALLFYFLMEFVDGVNLRQLQRSGRLGPREALQIVPQICDALQYAHDEGVVHRDIKPENVLVDRKGRVKIADFGLAKLVGVGGVGDSSDQSKQSAPSHSDTAADTLTRAGQVMGTPNYMAPEQAEHPQDVDHRADIYALGVVFYEMLTGELPQGQFPPPSRKVRIDVRLDEVVLHALEKTPARRYQHASEVKTAVETITADAGKSEVQSPRSAAETRRQRRLWYGFLVSLVGLPIGLVLRLPVVWGLALVGIVIGAWKLELLARARAARGQADVSPPRPLQNWEHCWLALPQSWRRIVCAGLGLAALALLVGFLWPHREFVTSGPQSTDTWTFGWGAPWWKEVRVFAPNQQNWRELHAQTGAFAAGLASLVLLIGLGALLNAERGTPSFLLQVVDWPGGRKRIHWGRGLLVLGFFMLLAANLAALTNALMMAVLRDAPPLLLLIFMMPGFMLAPVLRLLAVTYLRHSPATVSARPAAPAPAPSGSRLARSALVAILVFLFVTLTATVVTFLLPESYESTARIRVEREVPSPPVAGGPVAYDPYFIQTEFEVIQSEVILQPVIRKLGLNEVWGKAYNPGSPLSDAQSLQILRQCLNLRTWRGTSLIEIHVFRENPAEAARLANAIAQEYQKFRRDQHSTMLKQGIKTLQDQFTDRDREVVELQREVDALRHELGIIEPDPQSPGGAPLTGTQVAQRLEAVRIDAEAVVVRKQKLLEQLKSKSPDALRGAIPTALEQPDPLYNELSGRLSFAEEQLAKLKKDFGPEHPELLRVQAQVAELNKKLDERIVGIIAGLEDSLASSHAQVEKLIEEAGKARKQDIALTEKMRPYLDKKRKLDELIRFRNILSLKLLSEQTDVNLPKSSVVEIVDPATPALKPFRPNKPLNIAIGALAGALLGLLAGGLTLAFPSRGFRTTVLVLAGLPLLVALGLLLVASFSHLERGQQPVLLDPTQARTNQGATLPAPANLPRSEADKVTVFVGRTGALELGIGRQPLTADALRLELRRLADGNPNLWLEIVAHQEAPFQVITRVTEIAKQLRIGFASVSSGSGHTFGPVLERVIPTPDNGTNHWLELATGQGFKLPPGITTNAARLEEWQRLGHADLQARETSLEGPVLEVSGRPNEDWDSLKPEQVEQCLRFTVGSKTLPARLHANQDGPSTWAFRTAQGRLGLLQIIGFTDNPKGIKLRYKLVQTQSPTPGPGQGLNSPGTRMGVSEGKVVVNFPDGSRLAADKVEMTESNRLRATNVKLETPR